MNEERDSQLSAMFDGELPGAECELLARRLTRDEALRAQWSRFSMIGATLRGERGVALHDRVAWRVQSMVAQEATYGDGTVDTSASRTSVIVPASELRAASTARWMRFARPVAGASIAASVAALSIFWLRTQDDTGTLLAAGPGNANTTESIVLQPDTSGNLVAANTAATGSRVSNGEPERYVTPPSTSASIVSPARLANYVVAHSEYSGPLSRRMVLLGLVATDPSEVAATLDEETTEPVAAGAAPGVDPPGVDQGADNAP